MANNYQVKDYNGNVVTISATDVGGGVQATNFRLCDATATNFMPTMDAVGRAGFFKLTDGTNTMPTMDAAGRAGFFKLTDGTNTMPTMDAKARRGWVQPSDGTNDILSASAANVSAKSGVNAQLSTPPGEWSVNHTPAAAAQATASQAAGGAGVRHVCKSISATLATAGTAQAAAAILNLRDGATGAGTILWSKQVILPTNGLWEVNISGLNIVGSANTAMTLEFAAAGVAGSFESVSLTGYDTQ